MSAIPTFQQTTSTARHRPAAAADAGTPDNAAPRTDGVTTAPLSMSQQRLWVLAQLEGANEAYNEPMAFRLRGPLDGTVLARAFDALTARHAALRTRLVAQDGEVVQWIEPPGTGFPLPVEELADDPDAERRLAELVRKEAVTPFDLDRAPLARGRLVVLGADDHVLLVTVHHIVFDGWSQQLMLSELGALYAAGLRGEDPGLPPLPLTYADYARRQHAWMASPEPAAHADHWTRSLAGAPPLLELPTDRPRPAEQDYRGGRVSVRLDQRLTADLTALARRHRVTLYSTILTGWSILLSRLSGQTDIVVGAPTANRGGDDVKGIIGFFVNTLALRVDLTDAPTGGQLLTRVRQVLRDGLRHVDLPFERVVELVNPPRSAAHTPLVQTMFAWIPALDGQLRLPDVTVEPLDIEHAPAKFDLALALAEENGCVVGSLDYATALFDHATVERYARYLLRVLTQLAAEPDRPVTELSLLDAAERQEVLARSGAARDTAVPSAGPGLVERFEAQVRTRPGADAVVAGGERLDYAALDRRANRLAHALIARGAGPDQVVGVHAGRTVDLVVGVLGVLKAGAAWLPLDPGQPAARLAAMVADAAPVLVLSDAAAPADGWLPLTAVEAEGDRTDAPGVSVTDDHLAYVIYTSGSTGRPKGVAVTHRSVRNLFDHWLHRIGAAPGEAASAWSSIGFDASVHELLMPLTTGAALHLVPDELRGDPRALLDWMRQHHVTQAFLPPAYVKWIDEDPETRLAGLPLRKLLTGVEPLPEAALHRMCRLLPGLRVLYGYGPTEATLYATVHDDFRPLERQCPIGRPLPGARMYLLDERLEPVPDGVPGEIFLGGAALARGYLHRPDLTEERFLPDPFLPGERLYRTGDLARRLPDGTAMYLGRRDDQVKLRGFRIEPGEVEAALREVPGVTEAVVLTDEDAAGQPRLVAGVGRGAAEPRPPHEWRAELSRRLPDYMIPAVFVELPRLPLNHSGKVDRAALRELARTAHPAQVNTTTPRDHVEMALHRIWRRLLLHPAIGVRDDFFDIGGTSISAIKLSHAVEAEFGTPLPIRDIMLHPTIEAQAGRVRQGAGSRPAGGSLIEFRPGAGKRRVVCVHPAGGTAFCYLPLAAALPEDTGVCGIQSPGIEAGEEPLPTVEAMARTYLELVAPRPDETLVLCGLSYGGLVAHEMGRLLAASGHPSVTVVLLDTHGTEDAAARAAIEPVDAAEFRDKLVRFNGMYPGIDDAQIDRYHRIYNHNRTTARDFEPRPSAARLLFVQAAADVTDEAEGAAVRDFWRRRADGGFTVEPVDCGHWDLLESAALPRIAQLIAAELARGPATPSSVPTGPSAALEA
ncbi:non-ribosomal peptide synthetase [Streptantibioticus cattleyicolor]|uniref:Amino acid adenylation domain protein n=1 Tax=Streptantibioticus cattleyicolor (strain ATCC 35852 / DSM 46488 / JCM 4925 / NBRC 14057 / NRRL 8057) TaxID=1003195 RepID=F8JJD5_STREN|nr:non-ribosomal peptide synthetase [Streptantibioticus cattleyicolor]AEW98744.1 amino acid adenylation domain protein [Streptantibioticus cattleyicolor NRRL 8057 = DSM 46488]CCB72204.1 Amino acid adenylation enzyme/thioester reductase family protein [Streptantibioticus cattleyicolor NRRL 8057 = DSM 46488]